MIKFGTGGWRAIIGEEFTKSNVQLLTWALTERMKAENPGKTEICIGYDRRFLSDRAARWAAEVVAGAGATALVIDSAAPTPLIMFTVEKWGLPYGMAVTASHNPAEYNGVKVFTQGGRDAEEAVTAEIERLMSGLDSEVPIVSFDEGVVQGSIRLINPINEYLDSIIDAVDMKAIRGAGLNIALDPMYGVGKTCLQTVLITARCYVSMIHDRHDTLFGGRLPTPSVSTLDSLRSFVLDNKCHLGIATDGDADRLGIIDEEGRFVHPNQILVLLYYYLVKHKGWSGPAVRNLATTHLLDRVAAGLGEQCLEVPVGFKHISAKMNETDAVIGGESSGGLTVRGHIHGKDGIYAAALLVEMIAVTGKTLSTLYSDITQEYGDAVMAENDFRFTPEKKIEVLHTLMEEKKLPVFDTAVEKTSYIDGCKVYFTNGGWLVARFSGTEPLLRIFCEMPTREEADAACESMASFLRLK